MSIVEEVIDTWRDAERVLDDLPTLDPRHTSVREAVASLRRVYQDMTRDEGAHASNSLVVLSREAIDSTRALLAEVRGPVAVE